MPETAALRARLTRVRLRRQFGAGHEFVLSKHATHTGVACVDGGALQIEEVAQYSLHPTSAVKEVVAMLKRRNPLGNLPILRKGGAHQRCKSGSRQLDRRALVDEVGEWYDAQDPRQTAGLDGQAVEPFLILACASSGARSVRGCA